MSMSEKMTIELKAPGNESLTYSERLKLEAGRVENLLALSVALGGIVASGVMKNTRGSAFVFGMGVTSMGIALGSIKMGADMEMKMEKMKLEFEEKQKEEEEKKAAEESQKKRDNLFTISNPSSMPGQIFSGSVLGQYY